MLARGGYLGATIRIVDSAVSDEAFEKLARQLVSEGRLPSYGASQILAGYGDESACALCGRHVARDDVMYELRFGSGRTAERFTMHLKCFLSWERVLLRK